jgi:hypothetical protein
MRHSGRRAAQVHGVFESLLLGQDTIRAVLLNGSHRARDEVALLRTGTLPSAPPTLAGLLPTLQSVRPELRSSIDYHPSAASCLEQPPPMTSGPRGHFEGDKHVQRVVAAHECAVQIAVVTPGRLVQHLHLMGTHWLRGLDMLVRTSARRCVQPS